jgi:signal transduction histidine kinase
VTVIHEDERGRLWVGTSGGLALFDGKEFRVWSERDGLPSGVITALGSREGVLWIGTPAGLAVFDGKSFRTYGTKDGLASQQISMGAALRARDGSLWFGTPEGAVRQVEVRSGPEPPPPRLEITQVASARRRLTASAPLALAADETQLSFHYAALSFRDEAGVRYSSRLEGFEPDWSPERSERSIRFTNLPPGRYRFLVRARVREGAWSEPAAVALELAAPWWATPAFRALLALLLLGLGYAGYSLRVRALRREQERRYAQRLSAQQELLAAVRHINAGLALDAVLQNLAVDGAMLAGGKPVGIGLVRDGAVVFGRVWQGGNWEEAGRVERLGEGVAGGVAATGESRIVADRVAVPIRDRTGAVVGVMEVARPVGRPAFTSADRELLELLAHQAAVAIENASLYGDLQEKRVLLSESMWAMEELWKNEQRMREQVQELDRLKTNFMIVTAHEMRTPLTILKGHAELLLAGSAGEVPERQRRLLEVLQRNVDRMSAAFADILQMLQIEERRLRLRRQQVALEPIVQEAACGVRAFLELRRQTLEIEADPGLPRVLADPEKIHLVVTNLLENAIRFTPDEGRIRVRLWGSEGEDEVRLIVEDTGIGIEPKDLERVFEKFYTSMDSLHHKSGTYQFKTRGAGLGLSIARAYVEAHGGRIWAESAGAGQGSAFHVVLPVELKGLEG